MASSAIKQAVSEAAQKYTKPDGKIFQYGTAGVSFTSYSLYPSLGLFKNPSSFA